MPKREAIKELFWGFAKTRRGRAETEEFRKRRTVRLTKREAIEKAFVDLQKRGAGKSIGMIVETQAVEKAFVCESGRGRAETEEFRKRRSVIMPKRYAIKNRSWICKSAARGKALA